MPKKFLFSPFFIFLLILILIGVIIAAGKESRHRYQTNEEINDLERKISSLKDRKEALLNFLDYFNSEAFLEKEARLKLNLLKEGEKLVIISSDKETDLENQILEKNKIEGKEFSNFRKWRNYLFGQN